MAGSIDPVIAEALGEIGNLHGLLKAHVEEVKRDRLRVQEERAEDRLERAAMRDDIRKLASASEKIEPMNSRLEDAEAAIEEFRQIRFKVTVAAAVLSGGFYLAWQVTAAVWPAIKGVLLK